MERARRPASAKPHPLSSSLSPKCAWSDHGEPVALMLASGSGANAGPAAEHARWLAYTALLVGQAVRAYSNRSLGQPVHRLSTNGFLLGACLVSVAVQAVIPFVPALADAFRATPLDAIEWTFVVVVVALAPSPVEQVVRLTGRTRVAWPAGSGSPDRPDPGRLTRSSDSTPRRRSVRLCP